MKEITYINFHKKKLKIWNTKSQGFFLGGGNIKEKDLVE